MSNGTWKVNTIEDYAVVKKKVRNSSSAQKTKGMCHLPSL